MRLCKDCKFYEQRDTETNDLCSHSSALYGGVRAVRQYDCRSMRAGICGKEAKHWSALDPKAHIERMLSEPTA